MKKSRIPGSYAVNKATTVIPPKGKRWKGQFDDGGYMDRQAASRQQAQQGVGAIPLWGQLAGATMSISDGIRGDQSDPTANAIANVISPSSGIRNAYESGHSEDMLVAAFNPIGGGILAAQRSKEDAAKRQAQFDAMQTRKLIDNSGGAFAKGGKISTYPKVERGGYLSPISPDAVEVVGDNPQQTDGVELDNAFVDHNEIIDRENRVFSDVIKGPNGKSIASNAKRLEKMKNNDSRFRASNEHVDRKIDELFDFQEQMKRMSPPVPTQPKPAAKINKRWPGPGETWGDLAKEKGEQVDARFKEYMKDNDESDLRIAVRDRNRAALQLDKDNYASGGKIHIKPENRGKFTAYKKRTGKTTEEALHSKDPHVRKMANFARNAKKWHHAEGGRLPFAYDPTEFSSQEGQMDLNPNGMFGADGEPIGSGGGGFSGNSSGNWQNTASQVAAFAPNIANIFAQRNLKGPAAPTLETPNYLNRVNANDQIVEANRQARLAQQVVNRNTAQGSNLVSATGSILAKRLANQNQIYGDVNRQNAAIQAQEAMMNTGVRARNADRQTAYMQGQNDFSNMKIRLASENLANATQKIQVMNRERNQRERDAQEMQLIQSAYGDSGVLARLWENNPALAAALERSLGVKSGSVTDKAGRRMGGRLAKLNSSYC